MAAFAILGSTARSTPSGPDWSQAASFYAGRSITLHTASMSQGALGWTAGNGEVWLREDIAKTLGNRKTWCDPVRGVLALTTLIHEAIHNRDFAGTGFRDSRSESQAAALASELIPDLLQRFCGIPIGSALSERFAEAAKELSSYQAAYS